MKKLTSLFLSSSAVFLLAACGNDTLDEDTQVEDPTETVEDTASEEAEDKIFSLDELSTYNGEDGTTAYVAIDGIVYDVTDVPAWADGKHKQGLTAGKNHTDAILDSPHGKGVLDDLPKVGTLAEE